MKNFKTWLENHDDNPIIFLDLDETLISTIKLPSNIKDINEMISLGGIPIDNSYVTFIRPHAIQFINNMKSIAKTCIITAGTRTFQTKVLKEINLPINDNDIFCLEDYDLIQAEDNKLPKNNKSVLVDDLDYTTERTMAKLYAIQIDEDRCIKINPFKFSPIIAKKIPSFYENDNELLTLEPIIKNMFNVV